MPKLNDLTGRRFGQLVVVERDGIDRFNNVTWRCLCDCGAEKITAGIRLTKGETKSCGGHRVQPLKLPPGEASFNHLYSRYRCQARRAERVFELPIEQFRELVTKDCYYCGAAPTSVTTHGRLNGFFTYNGVDRVDNTLGYVPDNVVTSCGTCNLAKHNLSQADFIAWLRRASDYVKENHCG